MDDRNQTSVLELGGYPSIEARYRAVLWEPIESTGERVVALLCIEPVEGRSDTLRAETHVVLNAERLAALLGKRRAQAAFNVLSECAAYMSSRQMKGEPLEQVQPLFHGFTVGPIHIARAFSPKQLLDAAVRTLTIFGDAGDLFFEDHVIPADVTQRTADFIRQLRRTFAAGDSERQRRFHVKLQREQNAPAVVIDYAANHVLLQITSVPGSPNQAPPAESELKSKILDLEIVRDEFGSNKVEPTLMLNVRSLEETNDAETIKVARRAHDQMLRFADWAKLNVIEVRSATQAAEELERLS